MNDDFSPAAVATLVVIGMAIGPVIWQYLWQMVAVGHFGASPLGYWTAFALCGVLMAIRVFAYYVGR